MAEDSLRQRILLESGTNEVEIMEFYLGSQSFGINVAKVKQLTPYDEKLYTELPASQSHPYSPGTFMFREKPIPLIDLNRALERSEDVEKKLVIVTEFNGVINGFLVSGVNRIHRISWKNLQPLHNLLGEMATSCTGSVNIDQREVLIVDLERIISEINPTAAFKEENEISAKSVTIRTHISDIRIAMADDSAFIRTALLNNLQRLGFKHLMAFEDGQELLDYLSSVKELAAEQSTTIQDFVDVVISDIEMPMMDGLTVCRLIKEDNALKGLPVILFSSLINSEMIRKCQKVGADGYLSKPKVHELIAKVEEVLEDRFQPVS